MFKAFSNFNTQDLSNINSIRHFLAVDILRGFAAITILIWHYHHFFWVPNMPRIDGALAVDRIIQPYYSLFKPIYEAGFWAVQAFWVISGFVFAYVYVNKKTTGFRFAAARFSRLYPLHFITLIFIGALQILSMKLVGHYQIVEGNSAISFLQQLLFISGWGLPGGGNFNDPIWSVSVEIAIYMAFFFVAFRLFTFGLLFPFFIVVVMWVMIHADGAVNNFALCAYFFFIGTMLYYWLVKFNRNIVMMIIPIVFCVSYFVYLMAGGWYNHMRFYDISVWLFIPMVLAISWLDFWKKTHKLLSPFKWVGDLTYSTYLWHFPIQVLTLLIFSYFGLSQDIFTHKYTFIIWIVSMVVVGRLSFIYIEKPLQVWCNKIIKEKTME